MVNNLKGHGSRCDIHLVQNVGNGNEKMFDRRICRTDFLLLLKFFLLCFSCEKWWVLTSRQ